MHDLSFEHSNSPYGFEFLSCGAELLRKSAEHVLTELVQRVFTRLVSIPPDSEQDQVLASLEPPALVRHLLLCRLHHSPV